MTKPNPLGLMCGVYRIVCTPTGDQYVGKSVDIYRRWRAHSCAMAIAVRQGKAGMKSGTNLTLQKLAIKYGMSAFQFEVLEVCSTSQIATKELFWISKLQPSVNTHYPKTLPLDLILVTHPIEQKQLR